MKNEGTAFSCLGPKIRSERKRLHLTQASLSDGIVTRNMLSRIENGNVLPSLNTLSLLAERLDVSIGYLLTDSDDGGEEKNRRLLMLAYEELEAGHYEISLEYASCLPDSERGRSYLMTIADFRLGVALLYNGSLRQAQRHIANALKDEAHLPSQAVAEGRVYRALLDAFSFSPEQGKEEEAILSVLKFAVAPTDLSLFASVLSVLRTVGPGVAVPMLHSLTFSERSYPLLLLALIAREEGDREETKKRLLEAMGYPLISPLKAYCYSLLEEVSAALSDFENAYAYMNLRRELMQVLQKK